MLERKANIREGSVSECKEHGTVEFKNVSFRYPHASEDELSNINFRVNKGETLAVIGATGSGKTTLVSLIPRFYDATEGEVLVDGISTADEDRLLDIRRTVGMVFQNPDNQIVANVVEDDVAFAPENLGVEPKEIRRRVDNALRQVDMYEFRQHAPHLLSGGQKQRVAIAGVIAMEPEVIVLDEPTAMLDPKGRAEVISTVTKLCREKGITVVLITHHMSECIGADRVIVMSNGNVIADDSPENVFSQVELMKSEGLTVPATTELMFELNKNGWDLPLTALGVSDCAKEIAKELK